MKESHLPIDEEKVREETHELSKALSKLLLEAIDNRILQEGILIANCSLATVINLYLDILDGHGVDALEILEFIYITIGNVFSEKKKKEKMN